MRSNTLLWSSEFLIKLMMTSASNVALVLMSKNSFDQNKSNSGLSFTTEKEMIVALLRFIKMTIAFATISLPWNSTLQACIHHDTKLGTALLGH